MAKGIKLDALNKFKDVAAEQTKTPLQTVVPTEEKKRGRKPIGESKEMRATFIVKEQHLEMLKNYVFHQKMKNKKKGYTLKDALNEALELFSKKIGDIEQRPEGF